MHGACRQVFRVRPVDDAAMGMVFVVQLQKVAVTRENDALLLQCIGHMRRVRLGSQSDIVRGGDVKTRAAQQTGHRRADVLVQMQTEILVRVRTGNIEKMIVVTSVHHCFAGPLPASLYGTSLHNERTAMFFLPLPAARSSRGTALESGCRKTAVWSTLLSGNRAMPVPCARDALKAGSATQASPHRSSAAGSHRSVARLWRSLAPRRGFRPHRRTQIAR